MNETILDAYASLIIKKGINISRGQCVRIAAAPDTYPFALKILEKAYEYGAKYVQIEIASDYEMLYRAEKSDPDFLSYVPDYNYAINNTRIAENWAFISITNTSEFDILKDTDPDRIQTIVRHTQQVRRKLRNELMVDNLSWTVVAYPTEAWAKKVFGSNTADRDRLLENAFMQIMRLDQPDPEAAWESHGRQLKARCASLNTLKLDRLIIQKKNEQLEVGLTTRSIWHGGPAFLPNGALFMPNLPTEEVFTTPDYRRTYGVVSVVKSVEVLGTNVKDLKLEFKEGKVINFSASQGEEMMTKYLSIDPQASYLGEVALVDASSPINRSGLYFNSILFDENASSHIALGGGYPSCIENGSSLLEDADKLEVGCNVSAVHTDFMIGDETTHVTGITLEGKEIEIMKNGTMMI